MPVDIGVYHAAKPQDMAIEQWLNNRLYETQNVINLAEIFEQLPADMTKESAIYTLVRVLRESQVDVSTNHHFRHALNIFTGAKFCKRTPQP